MEPVDHRILAARGNRLAISGDPARAIRAGHSRFGAAAFAESQAHRGPVDWFDVDRAVASDRERTVDRGGEKIVLRRAVGSIAKILGGEGALVSEHHPLRP